MRLLKPTIFLYIWKTHEKLSTLNIHLEKPKSAYLTTRLLPTVSEHTLTKTYSYSLAACASSAPSRSKTSHDISRNPIALPFKKVPIPQLPKLTI